MKLYNIHNLFTEEERKLWTNLELYTSTFENMIIDEVKILLGRKIDQAEIDRLEAFVRKEWEVETYYSGVKEGLLQAKQVIGMLHSDHNHLKR